MLIFSYSLAQRIRVFLGNIMKANYCKETGFWFVSGFSGYKYWGHSARAAELLAQSYFYR